MKIRDRLVGPGHPCFVIAEVAQAHDGSLGTAHAYIDAAARTGVDAVKFQTHIAAAESTPGEPFRVHFSKQDANRYDYWKRMEFTPEQWAGLSDHARDVGLVFLSSAFSFEAVDLLERLDMAAWKVGSGETTNLPFLRRVASTGRPVLLSTGVSPWKDVDAAVECIDRAGAPRAIFQCTTAYPCPPEKIGLNLLAELRTRYGGPVGLSDHSAHVAAGLAAVTLGASLLEVHVVMSRESFGPDVGASLTTDELRMLVDGIRFVEKALASPVDKDAAAADLAPLRTMFGKSVVAARELAAGRVLTREDLGLKKPGDGIAAARLDELIGRTIRRALARDEKLKESDVE
ncbi:MAG: N-acetylneuraminate synthase family protein [Sandaracinus sp.]